MISMEVTFQTFLNDVTLRQITESVLVKGLHHGIFGPFCVSLQILRSLLENGNEKFIYC